MREHDQSKAGFEQRSDGPDDQRENPTRPGDAEIQPRESGQEPVNHVALIYDLRSNLLGDIYPASNRHRTLGEMAEFVGAYRLELTQRKNVDQAESDCQILARWND